METAPEKLEYKAYNELSTIIQSPVEPYYSSSDLEDFSVDDDDVKQEEYISPLKQWLSVDEHISPSFYDQWRLRYKSFDSKRRNFLWDKQYNEPG